MNPSEIYIFGASHIGLRLAGKLSAQNHVVVFDQQLTAPETPDGYQYLPVDFTNMPDLSKAKIAYIVTDEDKLNIRLALAIGKAHADLPVVITLVQSRLGKKLSRHLQNFSFISPPELAAQKFVEALNAVSPVTLNHAANVPIQEEPEVRHRWQIDPLVLRALLFFSVIAIFTTIYFHFAENLSWIDSWYFVVTLMTTVGFGDISLKSSSTLSKIIGTILMIASVTNTAIIFALITDSLLRQRLSLTFGRRKLRQSDHVIVVGLGAVGLQVVEELLERGETITLIEDDMQGRFMPTVLALRVPIIIGDAKLERTLRDAGLERAKALISVTSDDLTNLEIGLNAKSLNPDARVVLRIYDHLLAQTLDNQLDIHFALSTSAIAAEELTKFSNP